MKRFHIALAVADLDSSVREYVCRLGVEPVCVVPGVYALWRTDQVNFSISVKPEEAGTVRHLGFEDSTAPETKMDCDLNGFEWEHFSAVQQREEIVHRWPNARYPNDVP